MRITANNGQQVFEHFGLLTNGNIDRLVIYGNGKKYAEIGAGRIEPKFTKPNKYGNNELYSKYYYSIEEIRLSDEVKRANKENLNRKDNYILRVTTDRSSWARTTLYALYINVSECNAVDMGEMVANQTEDETDYLHAYALTFANPVLIRDAIFERIVCESFDFPKDARIGDGIGTKKNPVYDYYYIIPFYVFISLDSSLSISIEIPALARIIFLQFPKTFSHGPQTGVERKYSKLLLARRGGGEG